MRQRQGAITGERAASHPGGRFGRSRHLMVVHDPRSFIVVSEHRDLYPVATYNLALSERQRLRYRMMARTQQKTRLLNGRRLAFSGAGIANVGCAVKGLEALSRFDAEARRPGLLPALSGALGRRGEED
jgi:hypothetical protein